jgi:hypothetical protein
MHAYALHISWHSQKKISRRFYFSKSFVQFMASDINSFLNLDYPFSVISTNTRVSRSKTSLIHEYICPPRNNEPKKYLLNGRKLFYCNYCLYGNTIIINLRQHLFNQHKIQIETRINYIKVISIEKLLNFWNTAMKDRTINQFKSLIFKKILNKDIFQKTFLKFIITRNFFWILYNGRNFIYSAERLIRNRLIFF